MITKDDDLENFDLYFHEIYVPYLFKSMGTDIEEYIGDSCPKIREWYETHGNKILEEKCCSDEDGGDSSDSDDEEKCCSDEDGGDSSDSDDE